MQTTFIDQTAPKKPTNVSINSHLLKLAKEYHINLSQTLEKRLVELLRQEHARRWLDESNEAINAYNTRIESDGVFSDGLRRF
nr:type II toxin-antitoxin system CcdA family antitoxin [Desulfobulbaceae bacterium]